MANPNLLTANSLGIELMPGVNDTAIGYDVNRIVQALNGTNLVPITIGDLTVKGNETITGNITAPTIIGPTVINPGPLTVTGALAIAGALTGATTGAFSGLVSMGGISQNAFTLSLPTIREAETLAVRPQYTVPNIAAATHSTASTTMVMCGFAAGGSVSFTPQVTGRALVRWTWNQLNNTSGVTDSIQSQYGSGTAPNPGVAITGTRVGGGARLIGTTTPNFGHVGAIEGIVGGLTLGTAYWFDLAHLTNNGGTATTDVPMVVVEEF